MDSINSGVCINRSFFETGMQRPGQNAGQIEKPDSMKPLSYSSIIFILILTLSACKKAHTSSASAGEWQLIQKYWSIGVGSWSSTPSLDSSVFLQLNSNGTYVSKLDGHPVAQGSYSIIPDTTFFIKQILELNNFKVTGVFAPFTVSMLGTNGQVLSTFDGFFMTLNNDTLTLSSALTPGGNASYTFVRK